jgi:RNase P subunit RPR2
MTDWENIERYRQLIRDLGLPHQEFALFGLRCPYCGKSDRINRLEEPGELKGCPEEYRQLWGRFEQEGKLVFCKFCEALLVMAKDQNKATPLEQFD